MELIHFTKIQNNRNLISGSEVRLRDQREGVFWELQVWCKE
jgi:hypothetical protein